MALYGITFLHLHEIVHASCFFFFSFFSLSFQRKEHSQLKRLSHLQSFNSALTLTAGKLVVFVTFMLALASGTSISSSQVFTAMMLYETLRVSLSILLPAGLLLIKDLLSTVSRVEVRWFERFNHTDITILYLNQSASISVNTTTKLC